MKYNKKYKFNEFWFDGMIPQWDHLFSVLKEKDAFNPVDILEIGSYEGRATVWLCENVLNDTSIKYNYDIIDTFGGSEEGQGMRKTKERLKNNENSIEENFKHNISFFKHINFYIHKGYSQKILPTFGDEEKYDFIYVDASHRSDDTLVDGYFAHKLLKKGGVIIFDDFGWKHPDNDHLVYSPETGISTFFGFYEGLYRILFKGYQVGAQKQP